MAPLPGWTLGTVVCRGSGGHGKSRLDTVLGNLAKGRAGQPLPPSPGRPQPSGFPAGAGDTGHSPGAVIVLDCVLISSCPCPGSGRHGHVLRVDATIEGHRVGGHWRPGLGAPCAFATEGWRYFEGPFHGGPAPRKHLGRSERPGGGHGLPVCRQLWGWRQGPVPCRRAGLLASSSGVALARPCQGGARRRMASPHENNRTVTMEGRWRISSQGFLSACPVPTGTDSAAQAGPQPATGGLSSTRPGPVPDPLGQGRRQRAKPGLGSIPGAPARGQRSVGSGVKSRDRPEGPHGRLSLPVPGTVAGDPCPPRLASPDTGVLGRRASPSFGCGTVHLPGLCLDSAGGPGGRLGSWDSRSLWSPLPTSGPPAAPVLPASCD